MKTGSILAGAALALVLSTVGCGGSSKPAAPPDTPKETAKAAADSPEAAIRSVAKGLEENRPQVLWESLPASYQSDVNRVVQSAAKRMDPGTWSRSVAAAQRAVTLMKSRREFLLQSPALHDPALSPEDVAANFDGMVALLETLVDSDFARLDRLERFDGGAFLSLTGAKLMRLMSELSEQAGQESLPVRLKKQFQGMKVTELKRTGDTAVLQIDTGDPSVPAREHEYVRIEGKWLPRGVAEGWVDGIASIGTRVDSFIGAEGSKQRLATLAFLAQAEKTLDELEAAEDADQFQTLLNAKVIVPMMLAASGTGSESGTASRTEEPAETTSDARGSNPNATSPVADARATVIIRAVLDERGRDLWQEKLAEATDKPALGLALPTGDGKSTRFEVTPVSDVQAFAKRIKHGTVKTVDDEKRTVTVEPPGP